MHKAPLPVPASLPVKLPPVVISDISDQLGWSSAAPARPPGALTPSPGGAGPSCVIEELDSEDVGEPAGQQACADAWAAQPGGSSTVLEEMEADAWAATPSSSAHQQQEQPHSGGACATATVTPPWGCAAAPAVGAATPHAPWQQGAPGSHGAPGPGAPLQQQQQQQQPPQQPAQPCPVASSGFTVEEPMEDSDDDDAAGGAPGEAMDLG